MPALYEVINLLVTSVSSQHFSALYLLVQFPFVITITRHWILHQTRIEIDQSGPVFSVQ